MSFTGHSNMKKLQQLLDFCYTFRVSKLEVSLETLEWIAKVANMAFVPTQFDTIVFPTVHGDIHIVYGDIHASRARAHLDFELGACSFNLEETAAASAPSIKVGKSAWNL